MFSRLIYTLVWSVVLLYASFPKLFNGEMDFSFQVEWDESARDYIVILIMTVMLFIVDCVYNLIKSGNNYTIIILSGAALFLLCMAFSLSFCGVTFFISGWFVLTAMKFLTTESVSSPKSVVFQSLKED